MGGGDCERARRHGQRGPRRGTPCPTQARPAWRRNRLRLVFAPQKLVAEGSPTGLLPARSPGVCYQMKSFGARRDVSNGAVQLRSY